MSGTIIPMSNLEIFYRLKNCLAGMIHRMDGLRQRHRAFHRDDSGQVLMLAAIFSLSLLAIALSIIPVGQAISARMQLQNAADAAALTAATWMARGANIQQVLNGVHFDFDTFIQIEIGGKCDYWVGKLASDTARCAKKIPDIAACLRIVPMVGSDWRNAKRDVNDLVQKQKNVASQFKTMQETINGLIPTLGFISACEVAKENGAGNLDAIGDSALLQKWGIGNIVKQALQIVESLGQTLGIPVTTTTLNPSLNPLSALQFSRPMNSKSRGYCGTMSCSYNAEWYNCCSHCVSPPIVIPLWTSSFSWQDTYYLSTNMNTAITFITARDSMPSYVLNTLFLRDEDVKNHVTNIIPASIAIASAEVYNDTLYAAGRDDVTYQPIFVTVVQLPLPYTRFLGVGTTIYGGQFKARLCQVAIEGIDPVSKKLIYH